MEKYINNKGKDEMYKVLKYEIACPQHARKKCLSAVVTITKGEMFTYHMLYKTGDLLPKETPDCFML